MRSALEIEKGQSRQQHSGSSTAPSKVSADCQIVRGLSRGVASRVGRREQGRLARGSSTDGDRRREAAGRPRGGASLEQFFRQSSRVLQFDCVQHLL